LVLPLGDCFAFACRATDAQPLGHLAHRVAPILDLGDRIALELVCETSSGHHVLLASKITKQAVYKSRGYSVGGMPDGKNGKASAIADSQGVDIIEELLLVAGARNRRNLPALRCRI
jgi:hypothetical protein